MVGSNAKISLLQLPPTHWGISSGSIMSVNSLGIDDPDDGRRTIFSCVLLSTNILVIVLGEEVSVKRRRGYLTHDHIALPYLE